jgi:tetratricopeptide (TPR) repeat protein
VARRAFERLEQVALDSAYWAALLGRSRAAQQQYRSAFALYRLALSRDPRLRGAHGAIAEIYRRTGHAEWAEEEERRERSLPTPDCDAEPLACEFMSGRYRDLLQRLADVTTAEALYWRSLAASELALGAFARLDALPPSPELHGARAEAFRIRGLHALSIKEWQAALELAPHDRQLKSELAQSYWLNQEYEIARPMLEELLRLDPRSPTLNLALGDTLLQLQRPEAAVPLLEIAAAHTPELPGARSALARAYARAGQWDRAIPHLEKVAASDEDGSIHVLLARAYANVGRSADAERMLKRSEELAAAAAARRKRLSEEQQITAPDRN